MTWNEIDSAKVTEAEAHEHQKKRQQELADLARAYRRCLTTEDGQKVLADLSQRFIMGNDTEFNSPNIDYEAAYHNGESGAVKYIIHQVTIAEKL